MGKNKASTLLCKRLVLFVENDTGSMETRPYGALCSNVARIQERIMEIPYETDTERQRNIRPLILMFVVQAVNSHARSESRLRVTFYIPMNKG